MSGDAENGGVHASLDRQVLSLEWKQGRLKVVMENVKCPHSLAYLNTRSLAGTVIWKNRYADGDRNKLLGMCLIVKPSFLTALYFLSC